MTFVDDTERGIGWAGLIGIYIGLLISTISTSSGEVVVRKPVQWLLNGPGVAAIASVRETSQLLDNTRPFVMLGDDVGTIPPQWDAIGFVSFTSFRHMSSAFERGILPQGIQGVMYDNEAWDFTPEEEQRDPARFEKLAGDLVHSHGLLFLSAPAVTLVGALAAGRHERPYDSYVNLEIAATAAYYADVLVIQAQGSEPKIPIYASFVDRVAAQARTANPNIIVLAGISTNPSGERVTPNQILSVIAATRDNVDGYWFDIPQPSKFCPRCTEFRPDIATEVLRRLEMS